MAIENRRIGRVEGILEEVRARLNNLENRFDSLESLKKAPFLIPKSQVDIRFYLLLGAMVGVIISMWVTIILAIIFKG